MKPATIHQLKQELALRSGDELHKICLRLARYKAENKELLTYILFESDDEESYVRHICNSIDEKMKTINTSTPYFAKKGLQKVERYLNRWSRYSSLPATEVELRLHFCHAIQESSVPLKRSKVMINLYNRQITKIEKAVRSLHEDLQFEYWRELDQVRLNG